MVERRQQHVRVSAAGPAGSVQTCQRVNLLSRGGPQLSVHFVGLGAHDEVVPVQTLNLVGPLTHRHATPLGQQRRMMTLFFGGGTHRVREL